MYICISIEESVTAMRQLDELGFCARVELIRITKSCKTHPSLSLSLVSLPLTISSWSESESSGINQFSTIYRALGHVIHLLYYIRLNRDKFFEKPLDYLVEFTISIVLFRVKTNLFFSPHRQIKKKSCPPQRKKIKDVQSISFANDVLMAFRFHLFTSLSDIFGFGCSNATIRQTRVFLYGIVKTYSSLIDNGSYFGDMIPSLTINVEIYFEKKTIISDYYNRLAT